MLDNSAFAACAPFAVPEPSSPCRRCAAPRRVRVPGGPLRVRCVPPLRRARAPGGPLHVRCVWPLETVLIRGNTQRASSGHLPVPRTELGWDGEPSESPTRGGSGAPRAGPAGSAGGTRLPRALPGWNKVRGLRCDDPSEPGRSVLRRTRRLAHALVRARTCSRLARGETRTRPARGKDQDEPRGKVADRCIRRPGEVLRCCSFQGEALRDRFPRHLLPGALTIHLLHPPWRSPLTGNVKRTTTLGTEARKDFDSTAGFTSLRPPTHPAGRGGCRVKRTDGSTRTE
jgi:hypothetical protein